MVGRILFLTFGAIFQVIAWLSTLSSDGATFQHALLASLVGLGFMAGGVACGAAEGGRARAGQQMLVPVQPAQVVQPVHAMPPQQWPAGSPQATWPQSAPPYGG
jgi:hypothetical protein